MTNYPTDPGFYFVKLKDGISVCEMEYADYYKPPKRHYFVIGSDEILEDKDFKPENFIKKIEP